MKKVIFTIIALLFFLNADSTWAATLYAKTAGGNWSAAGTWSATSAAGGDNAGPPTAADNVIFELLSGNVTIDAAAVARSIDMTSGTGTYAGTLNHDAGITLSIGDGTAGAGSVALKFAAGTYTIDNVTTSAISFVSTSATAQDVNFASNSTGNVTYNASSNGSWKLTGTHNTGSTATINLTKGTLDTNGQTINAGIFNSSNSNVRTLTLGASAINLSGATTAWTIQTATNMTLNANTSVITLSGAGSTFSSNGLTYYSIALTGSGAVAMSQGGSTVTTTNFTRTGTAVKTDTLTIGGTIVVSGVFTLAGNSTTNRLLVSSNTIGTARTFTNSGATMTWSNVDLRDITLGTAYNASAITGLSGDCGGNTNITFTSAQTQYGVNMSGGASWSNSTYWATSSGGSGGRVPLPQDDVVLDVNSFAIP